MLIDYDAFGMTAICLECGSMLVRPVDGDRDIPAELSGIRAELRLLSRVHFSP
jgi:ribosomal protein S27E